MKNRLIIVISTLMVVVIAALLLFKDNHKSFDDSQDVYETGQSDNSDSVYNVTPIEREYEEGELEEIEENHSNIKRDDEVILGNDKYIDTTNNSTSFTLTEGSVVTQNVIDYLVANGYTSGTISSEVNGPMLLDGTEEFYTDVLMFIQEQYPDFSDEFYFNFTTSDMSESFYLIELYGEVIRVDFEF